MNTNMINKLTTHSTNLLPGTSYMHSALFIPHLSTVDSFATHNNLVFSLFLQSIELILNKNNLGFLQGGLDRNFSY